MDFHWTVDSRNFALVSLLPCKKKRTRKKKQKQKKKEENKDKISEWHNRALLNKNFDAISNRILFDTCVCVCDELWM